MTVSSAAHDNGIPQPVRRILQRKVLELRAALEDDFRRQLTALGIRESGIQAVPGGRILAAVDQRVREAATAVIERETKGGASHRDAMAFYIRESAFTFLNRVVGLRCLEERNLLLVSGQPEQAIRQDPTRGASSLYWRVRNELPAATNPREVWRETLHRAWIALSERIKVLFDPDSELVALLPLLPVLQQVVDVLNSPEIPTDSFAQDEFLGWIYQYYNSQEKDEVYGRLGKGEKLEKPEEIAAATCLYTERYMVDYLLQNTLGALWVQMHPDSELSANWPYFVNHQPLGNDSPLPLGEGEGEGSPRRLRDVTLMDPACGSGHFLVRAFDLLVDMYREEAKEPESEIPRLILERNLHGIDIDPRSVQIAALALYIKGCALAGPDFRPRRINLVAADALLPGDEPPAQYMIRFQGDREVEDLVKGIWQGLRNVREFGSLLHPERAVDEVVKRRREREKGSYWESDDAQWEQWKRDLLDGLREEFERESQSEDLGQRLFGQEAAKGVGLVEALGRRYDVVVANPPYQGSGSLNSGYKSFLAKEYADGKRDVYAAFILRCMDFCHQHGRLGMVTQQSWMFLRSFVGLRKRVLEEASLETIAHLGPRAFGEIGGEVVNTTLFTLRAAPPIPEHQLTGFRLIGPKSAAEKDRLLGEAIAGRARSVASTPKQSDFVAIPETPFVHWLRPRFFELLKSPSRLRQVADVRQGLATADNDQFTRCFWEVSTFGRLVDGTPAAGRWFWYAKGGGYRKWCGLWWVVVDWENDGARIKSRIDPKTGRPYSNVWMLMDTEKRYFFRPGLTYTLMCQGSLGARLLEDAVFGDVSPSAFLGTTSNESRMAYLALLCTRPVSYLLRVVTQSMKFREGYFANLPVPSESLDRFVDIGRCCVKLKQALISRDPVERDFHVAKLEALAGPRSDKYLSENGAPRKAADGTVSLIDRWYKAEGESELRQAMLHALEGANETLSCEVYKLDDADVRAMSDEVGTPAGWNPFLRTYDKVPDALPEVRFPNVVWHSVQAHAQASLSHESLAELKNRLKDIYEATSEGSPSIRPDDGSEDEDGVELGVHIPIPTETTIEGLSQILRIHPLSVHWLLQEMRDQEGLCCPPAFKRDLEDYASVSILRMLGYRWPSHGDHEDEHGAILDPELAANDGVIPLGHIGNEATAQERLLLRLTGDFGEEGAERSLREFRQWVGRDLGDWLRRDFFKRHVQQFKQRPIAWHLVSPQRTFEAFVLYHKLSRETLQKLRAQYAGSLIEHLRSDQERARARGENTRVTEIQLQIEDVEEFRNRIEKIERGDELKYRIRCRWKGEEATGRPGPYAPDIDDGVKVNIRPFQEAGILAVREVIKKW